MKPPLALAVVSLLLVGATSAAVRADSPSPQSLLPIETALYFQFDGMAGHNEAFGETVAAQILNDDFGPLLESVKKLILDALGPDVVAARLLEGGDPNQLIELQKAVGQLPRVLEHLNQHGVIVGFELLDAESVQMTFVFPQGGSPMIREAFIAAVRLLSTGDGESFVKADVRGRTVFHLTIDGGVMAAWAEGDHFVISTSDEAWQRTLDFLDDEKHERVTNSRYFKQLGEFRDFETYARGFIDAHRVLGVLSSDPEVKTIVDQLGLDGLAGVAFQFGCEGQYQRTTISIDTTRREGLLKLLASTDTLNFENLPPLPPDATSVGAVSLDPTELFDSFLAFAKATAESNGAGGDEFDKQYKQFEQFLGVDLRQDLFASLGSTAAAYTAPSEGALFFGLGFLIEVKDEEKLNRSLGKITQSLAKYDEEITIRKRPYRGTDLYMFQVEDAPVIPTLAVHDGWLVFGLNPQVAQGLIFRSSGNYKTWKPTPQLQATVDKLVAELAGDPKRKFTSFGQLDPRPTVSLVLSYVPLIFAFGGSEIDFDASLIPNSQVINERLSPNFSVTTDDGRSIRIDSYDMLPLPFDLSTLGVLPLVGGFGFSF